MRVLLAKDFRILRRSPLLVGMLVVYPLLIALLLGLALSRGPDKPRVAIYNGLASETETFTVGGEKIDPRDYARKLFRSVAPVMVDSREEALKKVRDGDVLAAIIIPKDLISRLQGLVALNTDERPTVEVLYSGRDPVKRQFVESTINSRIAELNRAVSGKLTTVAASYIDLLLRGGDFKLLGRGFDVVGLERSKIAIDRVASHMKPGSEDRAALGRVSRFAGVAIKNLDLSTSILSSVGAPVKVDRKEISGSRAPLDLYGVAVAVTFSLMLIGVLLGSGMLALEREEHTLARLLRGLTTPGRLVASKVVLAGVCAAAAALLLACGVSLFVGLDWSRSPYWLLTITVGGFACAGFGVGIGALAREVRAASLLAVLLSLPLAFLALVPEGALVPWLYDVIRAVSALFPFRPALAAINSAINGVAGMPVALIHLIALTVAWSVVGRLTVRRMA